MSSSPDLEIPRSWAALRARWDDPTHRRRAIGAYTSARLSFIPGLLPEQAVRLSTDETLEILAARLGPRLDEALDPSRQVPSPVAGQPDGGWLRRANVVGVNVRTVGSLWNALKYTLTLPAAQDAIHLLPIWEPGVVKSLYGPCSWELSGELFSEELAAARPALDTTEGQLVVFVNLLHALGRTVGMDVIPHTDRYSQMSLAFPEHFEWLRREGMVIADHRADLHAEVQRRIFERVVELGPALEQDAPPARPVELFGEEVDEETRLRLLFGRPGDREGREARRIALVKHLHALGYEPVPATMAPPYRGLEVDPRPEAAVTDVHGMVWRDYRITAPTAFSRVFGPLARYKLYERLDDNAGWAIDFDRPRRAVWDHVCERYAGVQRRFGFDFMRGDMSHVQMRSGGVPKVIDDHYDLLRAVKRRIQRSAPHFGYFAESFLAPPDVMGYGDEVEHLEASEAEVTLGNLQSMAVGTEEFTGELSRYLELCATRRVAPCFTVMTADKDDPRFDSFYVAGGPLRLFVALFLPEMPSYMGLGFETRDAHLAPAPNEHYTKLFVFQEREGPKATHGPYRWGRNGELYHLVSRLRLVAEQIGPGLREGQTRWLRPPDPTLVSRVLAWRVDRLLFLANLDLERPSSDLPLSGGTLELVLSTGPGALERVLAPGECRIYRLEGQTEEP